MEDEAMEQIQALGNVPWKPSAQELAQKVAEEERWRAQEERQREREVRAAALQGALAMANLRQGAEAVVTDAEALLAFLKG